MQIVIKELKVSAVIGVLDFERVIEQPLLIDLTLHCDMSQALISDNIDDAINYADVCERVRYVCKTQKAKLLEHLSYQVLTMLFDNYPIDVAKIYIKKPLAVASACVGVEVGFSREAFDALNALDD